MNFNELYPKKKEYYYLLMDIKTTAECNSFNCVIDKQKAKLLMRYINKKEKKIKMLNNIINELEKMMKNDLEYACSINENGFFNGAIDMLEVYLNKLQELKGADKEWN